MEFRKIVQHTKFNETFYSTRSSFEKIDEFFEELILDDENKSLQRRGTFLRFRRYPLDMIRGVDYDMMCNGRVISTANDIAAELGFQRFSDIYAKYSAVVACYEVNRFFLSDHIFLDQVVWENGTHDVVTFAADDPAERTELDTALHRHFVEPAASVLEAYKNPDKRHKTSLLEPMSLIPHLPPESSEEYD